MCRLVGAEVPRNACTAPSVGACGLGAIEIPGALSAVRIMSKQIVIKSKDKHDWVKLA